MPALRACDSQLHRIDVRDQVGQVKRSAKPGTFVKQKYYLIRLFFFS